MGRFLRIEVSSTSLRRVPHEYRFRRPAAAAHDRGHERAQAEPAHAEKPHQQLQAVRRVFEALARHGYSRRDPPVPAAPDGEGDEHLQSQPHHDRAQVLFRATLRRLDLAAEIYHIKEPQKIPLVMSPDEAKRLLAMAGILKVHVLLALGNGAGLRAGELL
jgi:hypothetical protein